MQFAAAIAQGQTLPDIAAALRAGIGSRFSGTADLAVLFVSPHLRAVAAELARQLREEFSPGLLLGVTGEGVIGGDAEIERLPAAALLIGELPGVVFQPFAVEAPEWDALLADDERLQQRLGTGEAHRAQLLLADPFTTPIADVLPRLDQVLGAPTIGGMASAAQRPGGNVLLLNDRVLLGGAVGVGIGGAVQIEPVVAQGCRPVGEPMVVTRSEGPWMRELRRRPALEVTREAVEALSPADQELLAQNGLYVGVVIHEARASFGRGDFLVRSLMGVDQDAQALAVGDFVRPGQTIQFHVRDAASAHEDLVELLQPRAAAGPAAGALLFSCNGRGTRMFSEPHHDVRTALQAFPGLPIAGFFAMGELGPVGGKSFIHGHTASFALFRPM